jgi:hypothetical protein
MQWHWRQWHLWPMVAATMAIVVVNCAAAVDAATNIPSSALMVAAKTPLPLLPSTATFKDEDCYCHSLRLPLPLPHSPWSSAVVVHC